MRVHFAITEMGIWLQNGALNIENRRRTRVTFAIRVLLSSRTFDNNQVVANPFASKIRRKSPCTSNDTKSLLPSVVDSLFVTHTLREDVVFDEVDPSSLSSFVIHLTFQKRTQLSDAKVAIIATERDVLFTSSTILLSSKTRKSSTMLPFGCATRTAVVPKNTKTSSSEFDANTVSPHCTFVAH